MIHNFSSTARISKLTLFPDEVLKLVRFRNYFFKQIAQNRSLFKNSLQGNNTFAIKIDTLSYVKLGETKKYCEILECIIQEMKIWMQKEC
jgi:hypothetical protein